MLKDFPLTFEEAIDWGWVKFEPYAQELLAREITADNLTDWLADQSQFLEVIHELNGRLSVAVDQNNDDRLAKDRLNLFREQVWSKNHHLMNQLEQKLIETNLTPPNYEIQLTSIRNNLNIFHPDNVELEAEEKTYRDQYENILGHLKFEVNGKKHSIYDVLRMLHIEPDRAKRELIYKQILAARTSVKDDLDTIWNELFTLRQKITRNAGLSDYREYMWRKLNRFDYTPQDVITFCDAIENVIVPLVADIRKGQASTLGVKQLKPWDKTLEARISQPLKPYQDTQEWMTNSRIVFNDISPLFAEYFNLMQSEGLMDLESRPNKSPWNYAERLPASNRTFIFINGRGGNSDLYMLFHEFGHAVHAIEMSSLPYIRQKMLPDEISEVASTTMELLASDHLTSFYPVEQAEIVRHNHLSSMLTRWSFAAMVALFQHWAYTHPVEGADPDTCDQYWLSLCERFMPGIDYTGFEEDLQMQWREVFQVFVFPFYFIEYAFAQLGAVQIWNNYQSHPQGTIDQFRQALSLGHTVSVPEFFEITGAKFTVNTETLKLATGVLENALMK
jgi:oligoendopeptidase F